MNINYECLPCLVNQVVRVAEMTHADDRDNLFRTIFAYMGALDFSKTNPEVIGAAFRLIKNHIKNEDPYRETRHYYNRLFMELFDQFEREIDRANKPLEQAVKYAVIGNIVDFNPVHHSSEADMMQWFADVDQRPLTIDHRSQMMRDLASARRLLYLGDNCGELCLDKLLIKKLKEYDPALEISFGVRGEPVINDSIAEDAVFVGMGEYARIISNGDDSMGTVLSRTSAEFNRVYQEADLIIAKGQANYESLSGQMGKNIYFLLMTKCEVIAESVGVPQKSLVCMCGAAASK